MDDIFEACHEINELLNVGDEVGARNNLIKLLDFHAIHDIEYSSLVNHLIRITGLYPYLDEETAGWQDRFVYEAFKVEVGLDQPVTLHREQSILLKHLIDGESMAVSAPTSFGKSFVVDAFLSIRKPDNVLIIVPTIALTDETRRRLYPKFAHEYKIITTSEAELGKKNIFIFPQERALHYASRLEQLDILIVDEFYKASTNFDDARAPTLLKAILKLSKIAKQRYFLAPNIDTLTENPFTEGMRFHQVKFNTVFLEQHNDYESIGKDEEKKSERLLEILSSKETKTLIYAGTFPNIDRVSNLLLTTIEPLNSEILQDFSRWLSENYDHNWALTKLVVRGSGIHNGRLHRSLSQIQVRLFELKSGLRNIISTSSIIEGVNTSAENVVIWANRSGKGTAKLDDFTYKNIMGRGGRMFKHFIGKIYILDSPPTSKLTQLDIPFPDKILGDLDTEKFEQQLTKEQLAKIIVYKEEMGAIIGVAEFDRLLKEHSFEHSDTDLIKKIAIDLRQNSESWNGLNYLNSSDTTTWDYLLYKLIGLNQNGWDARFSHVVEFTKILRSNWSLTIPEMLLQLEPLEIGIDDFFRLERSVTFKLAAIAKDVNTLQKAILPTKNLDISNFVWHVSHAFLPAAVYQLEEFGLPRMLSRKVSKAGLINFNDRSFEIHQVLERFRQIGLDQLSARLNLSRFEHFIASYFFEGIRIVPSSQ